MIEIQTLSQPAVASTGAIDVSVDQPDDIIRLTCRGFVTPEQIDASFGILGSHFKEREASGRRVKILVDNRAMSIQSAETAERIGKGAHQHHREHYLVATLLSSKLAAMQLRRILTDQNPVIFDDENEALNWLRTAG